LYKFMAYVEWPAGRAADGPLKIGVIGADEVAHELMRLVRLRGSQDRPVTVHRLRPTEAPTGLHALFIGGGYGQSPEPLLRQAQQESVLTVTENEQAFAHGSVINFKLLDGRVRFDISLPAAQRHNLRLSSRLIAVAHEVHRREP
ncbi:MAG TPA: YfiR family protein, partial [Noviherbaspirillum sp.]|nr:YfiR family protein [Noviherbaspirillum sp.]